MTTTIFRRGRNRVLPVLKLPMKLNACGTGFNTLSQKLRVSKGQAMVDFIMLIIMCISLFMCGFLLGKDSR